MKWADYLISKVRYENNKISYLEVWKDKGDKIDEKEVYSKNQIILLVEKYKFKTIYHNNKNKNWRMGDDVGIVNVNGNKYLRTDGNQKEEDNLGELPEF